MNYGRPLCEGPAFAVDTRAAQCYKTKKTSPLVVSPLLQFERE